MTSPTVDNQEKIETQPSDKELNFRKQEQMFQRQLEQRDQQIEYERQERMRMENEWEDKLQRKIAQPEEEEEPETYVDHKKFKKALSNFGQSTQSEIKKGMESTIEITKKEVRKEMWLEANPDFYDVLKNHSNKLANKPIAKTILEMPKCFEREQLVFQMIKELGLDKPEQKEPSIQEKIESNRNMPYYQPSGVGSAPYVSTSQSDFSPKGQKAAYEKMQELKSRLRIN